MDASKSKESSSNFEENLRKILECPICWETIRSVPVYQCINGHVVCKECIPKLESCCPICRINNSTFIRNRKLEEIIDNLFDQPSILAPDMPIQPQSSGWLNQFGSGITIRSQHFLEVLTHPEIQLET